MSDSFLTLSSENSVMEVTFHAGLDEHFKFPDSVSLDGIKEAIFDFDKVHFINSMGIKKWIVFLKQFEDRPEIKVVLKNCRRIIVDQINLIAGFVPENGQVESVYVPIYCDQCGESFDVPKKTQFLKDEIDSLIYYLNEFDCEHFPGCKKFFELDIQEAQFLRFLED